MDSEEIDWEFGLSEYIREGEPSRAKKAIAWQTAIGLQDVDGLRVSDYLIDTAKRNIEGEFSITAAQEQIRSYYEMSARQIAEALGLSDRKNVRRLYLDPALELGLIEMTIPDKPTSRLQKYRRVVRS